MAVNTDLAFFGGEGEAPAEPEGRTKPSISTSMIAHGEFRSGLP